MMTFTNVPSLPSDHPVPFTDQLRLAVAAYLGRFKGASRDHTESGLRCYLAWCAERSLDPLAARRPHLELYIRWMREIRRFKASTVSRRFSVTAGFYRTCVIDGLLGHSPAEHVRRPSVPPESPTLGFTHLQFEALLIAARESPYPCDFALVAMLGLLGLRIFEATGADIADLGEEHGHQVLRVCGKGTKVLVPLPPGSAGPSTGQSAPAPAGRSCSTAAVRGWTATSRPAACGRLAETAGVRITRPHLICSATPLSRPCSMLAWTCGTSRSPPGTLIRGPRCGTTGPARTLTATPTTSRPPTWPPAPDRIAWL
jgi:integrase/recombinase XerD